MAKESLHHAFAGWKGPLVSSGLPFHESCVKHTRETFNASRLYIIASKSLSESTGEMEKLKQTLGSKIAGVRIGMKPHTLWSEILEIVADVQRTEADLLITLGGGSLTDGAKIIALAVANRASTFADLSRLAGDGSRDRVRDDINAPTLPIICIPTTLSGGEFSNIGGGTNDKTNQKHIFASPTRGPELVILDPLLTVSTPDWIWLSSGIRAIDHCVEVMCSLKGTDASDRLASTSLNSLIPGLLLCRADRSDTEARYRCQEGVMAAVEAASHGIRMGASHGIGHQLGPLGVAHGATSCILLPAVCKYNVTANADRQEKAKSVFLADPEVQRLLEKAGIDGSTVDLSAVLDIFITALGMPRTLSAVGIGRDKLELLAENSLHDDCSKTNPIPLENKNQVLEILLAVI